MTNKVNIEFHTKQIEKLLLDVEKLKDKQREFAMETITVVVASVCLLQES